MPEGYRGQGWSGEDEQMAQILQAEAFAFFYERSMPCPQGLGIRLVDALKRETSLSFRPRGCGAPGPLMFDQQFERDSLRSSWDFGDSMAHSRTFHKGKSSTKMEFGGTDDWSSMRDLNNVISMQRSWSETGRPGNSLSLPSSIDCQSPLSMSRDKSDKDSV